MLLSKMSFYICYELNLSGKIILLMMLGISKLLAMHM